MSEITPEAITAATKAVERAMHGRPTQRLHLVVDEVIKVTLEAAVPHIGAADHATITNLRNALREAGKEMDRRYEMGAKSEQERLQPELDRIERHSLTRIEELAAAQHSAVAGAVAAERERVLAYVTERIRELAAMGWQGQGETVPQSELRKVADLLTEEGP